MSVAAWVMDAERNAIRGMECLPVESAVYAIYAQAHTCKHSGRKEEREISPLHTFVYTCIQRDKRKEGERKRPAHVHDRQFHKHCGFAFRI